MLLRNQFKHYEESVLGSFFFFVFVKSLHFIRRLDGFIESVVYASLMSGLDSLVCLKIRTNGGTL